MMNITAKISEDNEKAKKLYMQSFPENEQLPWWLLRFLTVRKGIDITAYYDKKDFCGFTYTVTNDNIVFVLFFAVKYELRSKGYGSAILRYLKDNNPDKDILLNIELLDESTDNYADRVRRYEFYIKNGFYDTGYNIDEVGDTFRVMSTSESVDVSDYLEIFSKMSFGLWKPRIIKA